MNLALLDPFRRQLPDRIDSTIKLPQQFHPQANEDPAPSEYNASFSVHFNRHGTYLATGHGFGAVPIYEFASRTLSAIHLPPSDGVYKNGVTTISWSRNSRRMMIGSYGDSCVSFVDNESENATDRVFIGLRESMKSDVNTSLSPSQKKRKTTTKDTNKVEAHMNITSKSEYDMKMKLPFIEPSTSYDPQIASLRPHRVLNYIIHAKPGDHILLSGDSSICQPSSKSHYDNVVIPMPSPIGTSAQIHPSGRGGIACLQDGSLVLFSLSSVNPFHLLNHTQDSNKPGTSAVDAPVYLIYLSSPTYVTEGDMKRFHILSASFDAHGKNIYATTQCGKLIGFRLHTDLISSLGVFSCHREKADSVETNQFSKLFEKDFDIEIPGKIASYQVIVSRKRSMILLNCKDSSLRLYDLQECWSLNEVKPRFTFQDPISKCKWASCDFSGDGEYVVGGCNNKEAGDKYELYFWNTTTGVLIDQLLGPQVTLYDISWHPTRSFVAVATSDGLLDLWGPRIDWTAFAPDFQALQKNVEYIEKEDEFDEIVDKDYDEEARRLAILDQLEEKAVVDICSKEKVAVFSDSEDEGDGQFYFNTNIQLISKS